MASTPPASPAREVCRKHVHVTCHLPLHHLLPCHCGTYVPGTACRNIAAPWPHHSLVSSGHILTWGPAAPGTSPATGLWHCTVPMAAWPPQGLVSCPSGTSSAWAMLRILLEGVNVTHQKRTLLLLPSISSALQGSACSHHAQAAMQSRQLHLRRTASFQEIMLSSK